MAEELILTAIQEDYLEAILELSASEEHAHSKDIAARLNVAVPTVSSALKSLAEKGLVRYESYQPITLTPAGRTKALAVRERHEALRRFFVEILQVPWAEADSAACRIEHDISPEIVGRMQALFAAVIQCPRCSRWFSTERQKTSASMPLPKLPVGAAARISAVRQEFVGKQRLTDLGLVVGAELKMEHPAPFGDPLRIRLKGGSLALRKHEAANIFVIPVMEGSHE